MTDIQCQRAHAMYQETLCYIIQSFDRYSSQMQHTKTTAEKYYTMHIHHVYEIFREA